MVWQCAMSRKVSCLDAMSEAGLAWWTGRRLRSRREINGLGRRERAIRGRWRRVVKGRGSLESGRIRPTTRTLHLGLLLTMQTRVPEQVFDGWQGVKKRSANG